MDTERASGRGLRIIAAVVAVAIIAVCGWCAGVYASGGDPFAFLSSDAFTTVEHAEGDETVEASESSEVVLTVDDVEMELEKLAFLGDDVSVAADSGANVVLADGGIWVELREDEPASTQVDLAARRASALAQWAAAQEAGVERVTWISEDTGGAVCLALSMATDRAPEAGSTEALLTACDGYRISGNTMVDLAGVGYAQSGGSAPVLPDGSEIPVELDRVDEEEAPESTRTEALITSGRSSSGGVQTGTSGQNLITVSVTVDGSAAGAGSSSARVSIAHGSSVYDALMACGVSVNAQSTAYGMYVSAIGGLAEKDYGSMSGWIYTVNGSEPNVACSSYALNDGDAGVWRYVYVE